MLAAKLHSIDPTTSHTLSGPSSIPLEALDALQADAALPVCVACGTQYPAPRPDCPICEDPRQAVPATGQSWTSLAELSESKKNILIKDAEDHRLTHIGTSPPFAINQHPFLIETADGSYIWDCCALISPALINHLTSLKRPLQAISISHPHFFSTSLTWSRALKVPLYLCSADREWYQRLQDITDKDQVVWFDNTCEIGPGIKVIQCGGHFPGSSILHWDRLSEPAPPLDHLPTKPTPVSGIILTADTIMVQADRRKFTFIWSVPNMIPLRPKDTLKVYNAVKDLPFAQASSSWPNRFLRSNAKELLLQSVKAHLLACGWSWDGENMVPMEQSWEL